MDSKMLLQIASMVLAEIPAAVDLVRRLQAGDQTAVDQAKDWLGITGNLDTAITDWQNTTPPAA